MDGAVHRLRDHVGRQAVCSRGCCNAFTFSPQQLQAERETEGRCHCKPACGGVLDARTRRETAGLHTYTHGAGLTVGNRAYSTSAGLERGHTRASSEPFTYSLRGVPEIASLSPSFTRGSAVTQPSMSGYKKDEEGGGGVGSFFQDKTVSRPPLLPSHLPNTSHTATRHRHPTGPAREYRICTDPLIQPRGRP